MDPTLIAAATAPTLGQYRRRALHRPAHARLQSLQRQLPGRPGDHRPAPGRQRLPGLAALRRGLRPDRQRRDDPPRRLRDLLRPAAGQHGLRHDLQRAGRPELEARLGTAAGSVVGGRRSRTRRCRSIRPRSDSSRRASTSGTSAFSTSSSRKSSSTSPTSAPGRPTCCGRCRSTPCRSGRRSSPRTRTRLVSRARSRGRTRCRTTSCGRTGATATSGCGTTAATPTTRRCRRR